MSHILLPTSHAFAAEGGISGLGIDPKLLLFQIISFALVLWLLQRYAFGPIVKSLDERYQKIDGSIKEAERLERANAEAAIHSEKLLAEAHKQAETILDKSRHDAAKIIDAAEQRAATAADAFLATAKQQLDRDVQTARKQLKQEMVGLVGYATEHLIHDKLDTKADQALIEEALKRAS